MVKFSVITICLNMEEEIRNTITSVLDQTFTDFEYLVKDGGSKDSTIAIAESLAPAFSEKNVPYRIISSADSGIYDAMNQAVCEARGDWVVFMNAGDRFANESVLAQIVASGCLEKADIVYGDSILRNQNKYLYRKAADLDSIRYALPFSHQSVFTRRDLLGRTPYAPQYRVCSDYQFYLQAYQEGRAFVHFPAAVARYDINGLSSNWKLAYQETIQILEEMPIHDHDAIQQVRKALAAKEREVFLHRYLWKYIPSKLRQKRRVWMNSNTGWTTEEFFGTKKDNA